MRRPIAFVALLAAGCSSATEPADQVRVVVRGTSFALDSLRDAGIPYEIVNDGAATVYIAACGGKPQSGVAIDGNGGGAGRCPANVVMAPVTLRSHGVLSDTVAAWRAGTTRLEVLVQPTRDAAGGTVVRSAPFEVR